MSSGSTAPSIVSSPPQGPTAGTMYRPSSQLPGSTTTLASSQLQPQQQMQPPGSTDPFSSISKIPSRQSSPFDYQQRPFPTPMSASSQPSQSQQPSNAPPTSNAAAGADEEEWTFASALPEGSGSLPASNDVTVTNSAINVVFAVSRPTSGEHSLRIIAQFTNNTAQMISDVTFQVAVTRVSIPRNHLLFPNSSYSLYYFHCAFRYAQNFLLFTTPETGFYILRAFHELLFSTSFLFSLLIPPTYALAPSQTQIPQTPTPQNNPIP